MEIKVNKEKILNNAGIKFDHEYEYFLRIKEIANELESHNKNYTREQYIKILDLKEILDNMEVL